jgi:hypothetical protein
MLTNSNKNQVSNKGFTVIESLLILVVVGILGFTGWFVWHSTQKVNQTNKNAVSDSQPAVYNKKYTDTAKVFTLTYPANWKLTFDSPQGGEGSPPPPTDWSKVSRSFSLLPSDIPVNDTFGRDVHVSMSATSDAISLISENKLDKNHTITQFKINGNTTYLDRLVYVGPNAAEKYTDDYYTIIKGEKALTLMFRESYYHNSVTPNENWNDSNDLPALKDIVNSVRFL